MTSNKPARLTLIENNFRTYAREIAEDQLRRWTDKGICNDTDEEFVDRVTDYLFGLIKREDVVYLPPDSQRKLNLFGYGKAREVLTEVDGLDTGVPEFGAHGYLWGHEVAEALGWDAAKFQEFAHLQWTYDLMSQRDADLESGVVGWQCMRFHPMHVSVWQGDGRADDHYTGGVMRGEINKYWCDLWLIHTDRLMLMMFCSPWSTEWFEATKPMLSYAMQRSGLEDQIGGVKSYTTRENALGETETVETGRTLADAFAEDREGITEQEAIERAMRGPVLPEGLGGGLP